MRGEAHAGFLTIELLRCLLAGRRGHEATALDTRGRESFYGCTAAT
jgi:hypothetical protein